MEWMLIATLVLSTSSNAVRDISPIVVSGFTSRTACDDAGRQIAQRIEQLANMSREAQGLSAKSHVSKPRVLLDCFELRK